MKVDDDGVIVLDSSSSNEDENEYERQPARQPARRAKPVTAQAARKSVLTSTAAPTVRGAFSSGKKIKAPVAARKAAPRAGYESENEHMEYIIREIISSGEDEQDDNDEEDAYDDGDTSFDESLAFDSKKRRRTNSSSAVRTGMPATKAKKSPKHLRKPQTPTKAPPRTGDVMKPSRRPRHFAEGSSEEESSDEDEDEFPFRRPPKAVVAMKSAERQQQTHKKQGHARPHGSSSSKYADVLSKSSVESPSEDEDAYARKPKKPAMQSSTKPSSREEKKAARKQEATPVMQQRPTTNDHSVAAASSARSSSTATRQADRESYAFTERISFSELQAQRRALEQIANQRRRATAASSGSSSALFSPPASSSSTTKSTAASARKSELFEFSQKKSIKRSRVDEIEKKVKAVVSPPASTPLVKATKEIPDVAPSPIADVTMSSTTTTSMTYTSQVSSRTSTYQSFGNQSDDHIRAPAMHGTTWRRLLLARSPPNILSPDSTYPLPFAD
uniref:Uncharacterized protein n=1 Tax=Globisporangium ultimum (strain ATCC 200006 / CBS 805.95 / DAOM BR144) TaxID=431595 RepID=K3WTU7_GLOUD